MIGRLFDKAKRELYRATHPALWGKGLQINGIPSIIGFENLTLGQEVSVNAKVTIGCSGRVLIGDRVTLSRGVTILTAGLDTSDYIANSKKKYRDHVIKEVQIGEGTWIAANVLICPGVRIGKNCIIAAGAVVSGDLMDDGCLYGGVPAKKIKVL